MLNFSGRQSKPLMGLFFSSNALCAMWLFFFLKKSLYVLMEPSADKKMSVKEKIVTYGIEKKTYYGLVGFV